MQLGRSYFFVGIGGSGMLPLALILRAQGVAVSGSDRALDQGRTAEKFAFLRGQGISLYPQDGSGVTEPETIVVASAAVENTVPDIAAAQAVGARVMIRAELLAELFNAAPLSIGVAGTSGKSTTTGMIGWMLSVLGRDPTVMNGAVMKNFVSADVPFASALVGKSGIFVSEVDESDGSIARYTPKIAVVNNISLDHKTMDELRALFSDFVGKADIAVLNKDNGETAALIGKAKCAITYSLLDKSADIFATNITPAQDGIAFDLHAQGKVIHSHLPVPGRHNVANALAALGAVTAADVRADAAADALSRFSGIKRRMDIVGSANGVTVIDDFGHNPDKIHATLATLHDFPGRLLILFQPHGYGPLRKMRQEFVDGFVRDLGKDDILVMPEPVYYGGTTERTVSSADIAQAIAAHGRTAKAFSTRDECGAELLRQARPGDRVVVMGARDDTLSTFAADLLARLA
jgi:UDP-N-acetylmuramate--alanine ligase